MFDVKFLLQIGLLPLIWGGLVFGLRYLLKITHGDDWLEKTYLSLMLIAIPIALVSPVVHSLIPVKALPLPNWQPSAAIGQWGAHNHIPKEESIDWVQQSSNLVVCLYLTGFLIFGARFIKSVRRLIKIERSATRNAKTSAWHTQESISAIASLSGRVIMSERLSIVLSAREADFICRHEQAHLDRRDPIYFLFLSILETVFWFNPFLRAQTEFCRHAAELDCDARVVGKETEMRSAYAYSLLKALKHTAGNARPCVPAAFSLRRKGDYRMRMERILRPKTSLGKTTRYALISALGCLIAPLTISQMSFAAPTTEFVMSFLPVEGKITSTFGPRPDPFTKKARHHDGMDIAAPKGTKIVTPCAGIVTRAELISGYGNLIEIDHGMGMVTRYGQLDSFAVKAGDKVTKGMKIGEVGMSGRATGPHLHFEVIKDGERQDPQSYLKK